jgi:anti-anti-sigma factor
MIIETEEVKGVVVFSIEGELDALTSFDVSREFRKYAEQDVMRFVFDLDKLDYINSSGLGTLIALLKRVRSQKGDIKLANLRPHILDLFELTKFNHIFEIYDSRERALEGFGE